LSEELNKLRRTTGTVLRSDHTYQFANCLGASDMKGNRHYLKASAFSILNENGLILYGDLVPSYSHKYVIAAYRVIFNTPGKQQDTWPSAICTDNVASDCTALTEVCHEDLGEDHVVDVIQVSNNHIYD
jgi:hypothetical protein